MYEILDPHTKQLSLTLHSYRTYYLYQKYTVGSIFLSLDCKPLESKDSAFLECGL